MRGWGIAVAAILAAGCPGERPPVDSGGGPDGDAALVGILVSPENVVVPLGEEVQLRATGLREDRSTVDLTAAASWTTTAASVVQVSEALDREGVVVGVGLGSAEITAAFEGVLSAPATVRVTEAELIGVTVQPKRVSVEVGDTVQLRATAAFSDNTRSDASSQVRWIIGDGAVATVRAGGLLTGVGVGETSVTAEWDGRRSDAVEIAVLQAARPDLSVEEVEVESGDGDVTFTVRIRNTGNVGASDYWVDVFFDPLTPPEMGDLGQDYFPVFYTDAGETTEVVFSRPLAPGPHTLVVIVDSDDAVPESDEGDNLTVHDFSVEAAPGGANLEITYFDYIADSETLYYVVDVTNTGSEPVGAFYIDLWIDAVDDPTPSGIGDAYVRVEGLAPGQTEFADFLLETTCDFCWSWAMADTNLEVEETNEDDNTAGPLFVDSPLPPRNRSIRRRPGPYPAKAEGRPAP